MFRIVLCAALLLTAAPAAALTTPDQWRDHVAESLARFWLDEAYHGDPVGSFPTFICADGRVWDPGDPCPSLAEAPAWITDELGRQYVRMISRQVYTYGVIFHVTGDTLALSLARAGTDFIVDAAFDPATGSVATYLEHGRPGPAPAARTTQSLAYALLGPAFLYYLTGDDALLPYLRAVHDHIFTDHWSGDWGMLRWANAPAGEDHRGRIELVAQLDQINAYLLLLAPLLEGDERARWEDDLRRLGDALWDGFHDPVRHRFFGYLHEPAGLQWGRRHNDFGHTAKAYWMLERCGRLLGEDRWVADARAGLADVLADALVRRHIDEAPPWQAPIMRRAAGPDGAYHIWANRPEDIGIAYWEWCELDQAAATLALTDDRWRVKLEKTLPTWFATFIDADTGAVYPFPGAKGAALAHHWQNGYHPAEHALVGYVTSAFLHGGTARLHFAPGRTPPPRAYLFDARITDRRARADGVNEVWYEAAE